MDQMELRSGKAVRKIDPREDLDVDPEEDIQHLMEQGNTVGGNEEEEAIPLDR